MSVAGVPGFTAPGPVARQLGIFRDEFAFDNHIHVEVWDWEVFHAFHGEPWFFLLSGGGRYGYLSQGYRAFRFNNGFVRSGTTRTSLLGDTDVVGSGRTFPGLGPTAALEVRRLIDDTPVSLYGIARGSVLFGRERTRSFQRTTLLQQTTTGTAAPRTVSSDVGLQGGSSENETIPMGDFEVGVDWRTQYGRMRVFTRAGVMNRSWFGAGSATSDRGDLGFFGFRFTVGVSY